MKRRDPYIVYENEHSTELEWVNIEELERDISEDEWVDLTETIQNINAELTDTYERNRHRELSDFAYFSNFHVGNEII